MDLKIDTPVKTKTKEKRRSIRMAGIDIGRDEGVDKERECDGGDELGIGDDGEATGSGAAALDLLKMDMIS